MIAHPSQATPGRRDASDNKSAPRARVVVVGLSRRGPLCIQGIVEHYGGTLGVLDPPLHGKPSRVTLVGAGADAVVGRDRAAAAAAAAVAQVKA